MFEIPNAKRVRRDELYDSSSDAGSNSQDDAGDVELRARLNERLSNLLGLDLSAPEPATGHRADPDHAQVHGDAEDHEGNHEEEFEFRLFSTTSKNAAPAKVVLTASDDEGEQGEGAFLLPTRPITYYMAEPTPEQREAYRDVAVTGEDIIAGAGKRAWGLERPWRVVKITVSSDRPSKGASSAVNAKVADDLKGDEVAKRKRPGKKRRIAMRIKSKAEKAQEEQKMTKEEHLKEKKKRLNREKKLKRRAKEKQQRLAAKANGEGGGGTQAGSAADSDTDDSAE
ncbi:hypothetical protein VP1G_04133 [Cytospora mali]|uniref:Uncharacterized protein n=1 Tax=Cytospora mali TaxID=578113 RepID=A0A194UYR2_CYTMA|nr:hypothetical protein VP1G_04133 [Valsa mali var. pyri (nom. inval.)]